MKAMNGADTVDATQDSRAIGEHGRPAYGLPDPRHKIHDLRSDGIRRLILGALGHETVSNPSEPAVQRRSGNPAVPCTHGMTGDAPFIRPGYQQRNSGALSINRLKLCELTA